MRPRTLPVQLRVAFLVAYCAVCMPDPVKDLSNIREDYWTVILWTWSIVEWWLWNTTWWYGHSFFIRFDMMGRRDINLYNSLDGFSGFSSIITFYYLPTNKNMSNITQIYKHHYGFTWLLYRYFSTLGVYISEYVPGLFSWRYQFNVPLIRITDNGVWRTSGRPYGWNNLTRCSVKTFVFCIKLISITVSDRGILNIVPISFLCLFLYFLLIR